MGAEHRALLRFLLRCWVHLGMVAANAIVLIKSHYSYRRHSLSLLRMPGAVAIKAVLN